MHTLYINSLFKVIMFIDGWDTLIGKVLYSERENGNLSNPCAMAVKELPSELPLQLFQATNS